MFSGPVALIGIVVDLTQKLRMCAPASRVWIVSVEVGNLHDVLKAVRFSDDFMFEADEIEF